MRRLASSLVVLCFAAAALSAQTAPETAIRAGRLLDPDAGRILTNQIILVTGNKITDVGPNVAIPSGANRRHDWGLRVKRDARQNERRADGREDSLWHQIHVARRLQPSVTAAPRSWILSRLPRGSTG